MTHKANIQLNHFLDVRDLLLLLCPQFQILLISSCLQSFNEPVLSVLKPHAAQIALLILMGVKLGFNF